MWSGGQIWSVPFGTLRSNSCPITAFTNHTLSVPHTRSVPVPCTAHNSFDTTILDLSTPDW